MIGIENGWLILFGLKLAPIMLCFSGGAQSSHSTSRTLLREAMPMFIGGKKADPSNRTVMGMGQELLNSFDPTGGELGKASRDYTLSTARGDYMDVMQNPILQNIFDAIKRGGVEEFNATSGRLGAQAQRTGTWGSNKQAQSIGAAGRRTVQDVSDKGLSLFGSQYDKERGYRDQAAANASAQSQIPMQTLQAFLNQMRAPTSSSASSGFNFGVG
jgi:hypothetical protein